MFPGPTLSRSAAALSRWASFTITAEQVVFRHEQTLSKPKSDRLNLLKATRAHFGQIFMLYSDPAGSVEKILYDGNGPAEAEVTDEYGVLHRIWRVSDPAAIRLLATAMDDKKLIIADGHHRYETALNYSKEHAPAQPAKSSHSTTPAAAAALSRSRRHDDLRQHGLGRPGDSAHPPRGPQPRKLRRRCLRKARRVLHRRNSARADARLIWPSWPPARHSLCRRHAQLAHLLLRSKSEAVDSRTCRSARTAAPTRSQPPTFHHSGPPLGLDAEKVREQTNLRYLRDASEAVEQVRRGEANIAFLTNPVTMEQLREVAFAGDVMPQKSTDFFPKLLSGLAIYALD